MSNEFDWFPSRSAFVFVVSADVGNVSATVLQLGIPQLFGKSRSTFRIPKWYWLASHNGSISSWGSINIPI